MCCCHLSAVERVESLPSDEVGRKDGTTMVIALWEKNFEIALYFAQHPAAMSYVNAHGSEGETPLHAACKWEEEDQGLQLLVALVKAGANVNMKSLRLDE